MIESSFLLNVFCGKGGVGKTTLSVASALSRSQQGKRTLLVSSHPVSELALSVSLSGLEEEMPEAAERLFVIHLDARQVVDELVREQLPSSIMSGRLVENRVYKSFIEVVPGLKEFASLWRLSRLAQGSGVEQAYECVIWDAPATGHFLETMQVLENFGSYFAGPLGEKAREVDRFFRSAAIEIFPVTVAEEMAVDEASELFQKLETLSQRPGRLYCNLASPMLRRWANQKETVDLSGLGEFLVAVFRREQTQFGRLREMTGAEIRVVARQGRSDSDLRFLLELAGNLHE